MRKGAFPTILTKLIPQALTSPNDAMIPKPAAKTPAYPNIALFPTNIISYTVT